MLDLCKWSINEDVGYVEKRQFERWIAVLEAYWDYLPRDWRPGIHHVISEFYRGNFAAGKFLDYAAIYVLERAGGREIIGVPSPYAEAG